MKLRYAFLLAAIPVTWWWSATVATRDAQLLAVVDRQQHIERCARQDALAVRIYSPNRAPKDDLVVCQTGSMRARGKRSIG